MSNNTASVVVIRREDYTPPAFLIESVALEFDLVPARTVVRNTMRLSRNPDARADAPRLDLIGEQLEFMSASIDSVAYTDVHTSDNGLSIGNIPAGAFELVIESVCNSAANTSLSGLYVSSGSFFTQCEAEGFRRITYFLDRPDVMATYTVTLRADKTAYPVLLSNGNLIEEGDLRDGRHFAKWEDPFKKPSYLFALVAGKLVCIEEKIQSRSGKDKLLQVWVEPADLDKTQHAMDSLIHSIRWDEKRFGLELDLDRFMIVAVSDFNMGAMENKGLNIFNTKYVLANPETATDIDFSNIEAVVGHEYFHNWTGNRVTCRDWFQLSLKEGLTVFRDQEFSADMAAGDVEGAARATKRIEDVRVLRQMQFAEDAGPMAHPVRPESYVEVNNFYTMTVYEKGSEVVRMYQTLFGRDGFRRGMDLYFQRHDGQAVTCDDFRAAMADANHRDLSQFERWYSQAGTPRVSVRAKYDAASKRYTLTLTQGYDETLETPRETQKGPLLIPFAIGLISANGADLPLRLEGEKEPNGTTRVLEFTEREQSFTFVDVNEPPPLPSLLRNFSAPVIVEFDYSNEQLAFLLAHDSDPFNRWEAGQRLATRELLALADRAARGDTLTLDDQVIAAFARVLDDTTLTPAFRELALMLPSESYLAEQMSVSDPAAVHAARVFMSCRLATQLRDKWLATYEANRMPGEYRPTPEDAGKRSLKNLALAYLAQTDSPAEAAKLAQAQYDAANNMTDRSAALSALLLAGATKNADPTVADAALDDFYRCFESEALVIDKWFALQATQRGGPDRKVIEIVRKLMQHQAFNIQNPNRARSLIFSLCSGNPAQFHAPDGSGYAFWAEQVIALDALNPQVAARLARGLELWRRFTPQLREKMHAALSEVASKAKSRDVREVVEKALAA
ncbi:Membrane alanine aminopeptidase N [Candidatus Burkholderia pumila]|uniref:Aminopeptidase N n=1 Tax=Candidatus Burkholderia pumila TaxID=1090375 RepID=A0ABR5HPI8_9BURK|nr:Membrane alanine aminopeptidase N [Candidatus Burkholderia pumila]